MALSWPNLPCALKAAIGIGKRTLGHPASLPRPKGRSKAYCGAYCGSGSPSSNTRATSAGRIAGRDLANGLQQPCLEAAGTS